MEAHVAVDHIELDRNQPPGPKNFLPVRLMAGRLSLSQEIWVRVLDGQPIYLVFFARSWQSGNAPGC